MTNALIAFAVFGACKFVGWLMRTDDPWSYFTTAAYILGLRREP